MKRLTGRDEFGNADIIALSDRMPDIYFNLDISGINTMTDTLNRLATYEDTGLTPKGVTILRADNARLRKLIYDLEVVFVDKPEEHNGDNNNKVHCSNCDYLNMDGGKR